MNEGQLVALAVVGWALFLLLLGQWWGERKARIFIQNYTQYGGVPLKTAKLFVPPDAEDNLEEAIDRIQNIAGVKLRPDGPRDGKYTQETLDNGVEWLLHEARESGKALTREQATEEAERMLNAEGTQM